jgi:hypothetical protein
MMIAIPTGLHLSGDDFNPPIEKAALGAHLARGLPVTLI